MNEKESELTVEARLKKSRFLNRKAAKEHVNGGFNHENYKKSEDIKNDGLNQVIKIPKTNEFISPILSVIPMQLFAYYISKEKGLDVDKPRNLAKSVTVE